MSRTWYLTALVPLAIGIAIAAIAVTRLVDNLESMQRLVAPGERSFVLAGGEYIVYGESQSIVDGTAYLNDRISVRCSLAKSDGSPIPLSRTSFESTYSIGGYAGTSMFEFELSAPDTVKLSCTTDEGKAVLAIGAGVGASIVIAILCGVFGFFGAIGVFVIVFIKRRRWRRGASSRPAAGAGSPRS